MRVLHVLSGLNAAGIESLALQLIRHAPAGIASELLNADRSAQAMVPAFAQLQTDGRLKALHQWPRSDGLRLAWRSFRLCRRRRPDVLLIYPCKRPMLWLALGARLAGVSRLAVHVGNTAPPEPKHLRTWHRLLFCFRLLKATIVPCSQAIVDSLQPVPRWIHLAPTIHNGCDVQDIRNRAQHSRSRRPLNDMKRIIMVARLDSKQKDHATLLKAYSLSRASGWKLWLVGEGPDRLKLEAYASSLGLEPSEVFLGQRTDIPELLGQSDLFAFSTTASEGFGIAIIEAMSAGLPIIASNVSACREVLAQGAAGNLLPPVDAKSWAERIQNLMASKEDLEALSYVSRSHANLFSITITAKNWYELLRTL